MQMVDQKWKKVLEGWGITTWLISRYMDDVRTVLPSIRRGWRATARGLQYCVRWEEEDTLLSNTEITKRVLSHSLNRIEPFLKFTMETCLDEGFNGWLPTLDTCLRVTDSNIIEYKYYEKDTCCKQTVHAKSAMNYNTKIQILSNDW